MSSLLKSFVIVLLLTFLTTPSFAGKYVFNYTPLCHKAYEQYMSLQFAEGNETIRQEMRANPYNLMAIYIADYADCLLLLFNGDKKDYEQLHRHLDQRQDLLNRGDASSPWYRLCKGGIYMHWAFVYVRMGEEFKAANNFRKSFALLKENREQYPDFEYNNIMFGLEEAAVGAIPDDYKWIAAIFGMKGSIKKGMAKIESFVNKHNAQEPMYNDALVYYAYLKYYLQSRQEDTWQMVNSDKFTSQNRLLLEFIKINIALNYRKADAAISALKNNVSPQQYKSFPIFYYEMGNALLHKLDPGCLRYFDNFLSLYNGGSFVKDTWYKKAMIYHMQGNNAKATECRNMIRTAGNSLFDADKKAVRFEASGGWPNIPLMQASQLIDGGYYQQALAILAPYKEADFINVPDKAEYHFRMGRAYDELADDDKALLYYKNTIAIGRERKEHFAARAALHTGMIYERRRQVQQALSSYQMCLDMPVQDFKNSIRQQAKAGINRITVK